MKILKRITKSSFFKNIALLASGSIFAQVIVVLCSPLMTRLFKVEEIGIYSYIIAMVSTFTSVLNLRYDMAIVSEKEENNIYPIIKLSIVIGLVFSILATGGFAIYFILAKPEYANYRYSIIFFFLLLVANSLINVFNSYNNRNKEYKVMTTVYVIRTACQNIGSVIMGFLKIGVLGLLLPYTIGQYFGMKRQSVKLIPEFSKVWKSNFESIKRVAIRHKRFPLFSAPAMIANSFSYSSVTIFMESLFDMGIVGYYSLSTRILGLPLSLVSGNVSKVFFQEASEEQSVKGTFQSSYKKTFMFLFTMAIPIGVVMYLIAPWACKVFFGESWVVAGEYIKILTPYYMCRFIGTALSPGLIVCKKQKQELFIQLLLVITSFISYVITITTTKSVETFLLSICITKSLVYILLILLVGLNSKEKRKNK